MKNFRLLTNGVTTRWEEEALSVSNKQKTKAKNKRDKEDEKLY